MGEGEGEGENVRFGILLYQQIPRIPVAEHKGKSRIDRPFRGDRFGSLWQTHGTVILTRHNSDDEDKTRPARADEPQGGTHRCTVE